jgi:hypothetical protein
LSGRNCVEEHLLQEYQILLSLSMGADSAGEMFMPQTPGQHPGYASGADQALSIFDARVNDTGAYERCIAEWDGLLGCNADFEDWMNHFDGSICTATELATLITMAPNDTLRHVAREMVYCRQQLALTLGYAFQASDEEQALFNRCEDEWQDLLAQFPKFNSWLVSIDRFTCSRATLLEAIRRAPAAEIRQALREMYCFRETASLATSIPFA